MRCVERLDVRSKIRDVRIGQLLRDLRHHRRIRSQPPPVAIGLQRIHDILGALAAYFRILPPRPSSVRRHRGTMRIAHISRGPPPAHRARLRQGRYGARGEGGDARRCARAQRARCAAASRSSSSRARHAGIASTSGDGTCFDGDERCDYAAAIGRHIDTRLSQQRDLLRRVRQKPAGNCTRL